MRPSTHEVTLEGGRLVLPLTMGALRGMSQVLANPKDPSEGVVDPGKVVRGQQDLGLVTVVDAFHACAGDKSPGVEAICQLGTYKDLTLAFVTYCVKVVQSLGPERPQEEPSPKA